MKWKTWAPAVLAVVLGGAAAKLARDAMTRTRPAPVIAPKLVQIAVANANLTVGSDIRTENVVLSTIQGATPPPDTFTNPADLIGRVVIVPVLKGQTILANQLAPKGSAAGLASLVPPGMRAMTVSVDENNGFSGMLLPGCRIDILGTLSAAKNSGTHTLVRNVLVQAIGQRVTPKVEEGKEPPPPYHTMTLIVTPHEAQLIELASVTARVRILLRGVLHNDEPEKDAGFATMSEITGQADPVNEGTEVHGPATQPSNPALTANMGHRNVELIKGGGAPQRVIFEIPRPVDASADQGEAIPGSKGTFEE